MMQYSITKRKTLLDPAEKARRKRRLTLIIFISLLAFSAITTLFVYASGQSVAVSALQNYIDTQRDIIRNGCNFVDNVKSAFTDMDNLVNELSGGGTGFKNFFSLFASLGSFVVMLHFWLHVIQETQKGEATLEMWLRLFISLAISMFLIYNVDMVFDGIRDLGNGLYDMACDQFQIDSKAVENALKKGDGTIDEATLTMIFPEDIEKIKKKYKETASGKSKSSDSGATLYDVETLKTIVSEMTLDGGNYTYATRGTRYTTMWNSVSILYFALECVLRGMIYLLAIQITLRRILAPLAIADVSIEGARSTGMRYMKHFLALYLQKVIIYIIAAIATRFTVSILSGGFANRVSVAGNQIPTLFLIMTAIGAVTGMVSQAGSIANEIVGD